MRTIRGYAKMMGFPRRGAEEPRTGHCAMSNRDPKLHHTWSTEETRESDPKLRSGQHAQSSEPANTHDPLQHIHVQSQKTLAALTRTATDVVRCQSQAEEHPPCRGARSRERAEPGSFGTRCDRWERSVGDKLPCTVG